MSNVIVYARNCEVHEVEEVLAKDFVEKNHSQESVAIKTKSFGIFHEEDLLGVLMISEPRTSRMKKEYSREIVRLCFKKEHRVIGGASKLVRHYIEEYDPTDFFTYQDTSGKAGKVYEHCGMRFVRQDKKKEYLVAPGKTIETGSRKEVLGMAYATRFGPDRILGTKLGEIYYSDGRRKSNRDIFIEDLGWHVETTSGDRVYEWVNPNLTFYTYKITASDSEKYYYGVSHVKKANASIEDCLNDGYYGSGGTNDENKFRNWKRKHADNLEKEIINMFPRKSQAYEDEKNLIGDLYKTDKNCLNSCSGGKTGGINSWSETRIQVKDCPIHGKSKFIGDRCRKCISDKTVKIKNCPIHGETKHIGENCSKCFSSRKNRMGNCKKHGETVFQGNSCYKCIRENSISVKNCPVHGETKFSSNTCLKCALSSTIGNCEIHGETSFHSGICISCRNESMVGEKYCPKHGLTKFRGDRCYKCWGENSTSLGYCETHGETKFRNGQCCKCVHSKNNTVEIQICPIHGESKHFKGQCYRCRAVKSTHTRLHKDKRVDGCPICEQNENKNNLSPSGLT